MLEELLGGPPLPAGALAVRVGVAPSTVSGHLVRARARRPRDDRASVGRRREARLAGPHVAEALEALAELAGDTAAPDRPEARSTASRRCARRARVTTTSRAGRASRSPTACSRTARWPSATARSSSPPARRRYYRERFGFDPDAPQHPPPARPRLHATGPSAARTSPARSATRCSTRCSSDGSLKRRSGRPRAEHQPAHFLSDDRRSDGRLDPAICGRPHLPPTFSVGRRARTTRGVGMHRWITLLITAVAAAIIAVPAATAAPPDPPEQCRVNQPPGPVAGRLRRPRQRRVGHEPALRPQQRLHQAGPPDRPRARR